MNNKPFFAALLTVSIFSFAVHADSVYFKGGLKTICRDRPGEEDGYTKCAYADWNY
ncbi:MAG: hypothetical protein P8X90_07465 [Desulfobacterales bacterium]|jgi:hypothetical protein